MGMGRRFPAFENFQRPEGQQTCARGGGWDLPHGSRPICVAGFGRSPPIPAPTGMSRFGLFSKSDTVRAGVILMRTSFHFAGLGMCPGLPTRSNSARPPSDRHAVAQPSFSRFVLSRHEKQVSPAVPCENPDPSEGAQSRARAGEIAPGRGPRADTGRTSKNTGSAPFQREVRRDGRRGLGARGSQYLRSAHFRHRAA